MDLLLRLEGERLVVVRAEVGVDHALVAHHGLGGPLGDDLALGHHDDPVGDVAHHVHVVLDEEHGAAVVPQRLHVTEQRLLERGVHPGHRLVEHHQLRVGHQRAGHLEELALAAGELPGEVLALLDQQEPLEQGVGALGVVGLLAVPHRLEHGAEKRLAPLAGRADPHVLDDRELREHLGQLEGADHAHPGDLVRRDLVQARAVERPVAAVGAVEPGEQVEEGGLAGAVRPDQRGDHAALDLHVLHVDRGQAAEAAGDVVGDHDRVGLRRARLVGHVREHLTRAQGARGRAPAGGLHRSSRLSGHRGPAPFGLRRFPVVGRS